MKDIETFGAHGAFTTTSPVTLRRDNSGQEINVAAGDYLLASLAAYGNTAITPPSGWVSIGRIVTAGNEVSLETFYKLCGGSEPVSYDFAISPGNWAVGIIRGFRYADPAGVVDNYAGEAHASSTSDSAPSVNTSLNRWRLACAYAFKVKDAAPTPPSGYTEYHFVWYGSDPPGNGLTIVLAWSPAAADNYGGATGNKVATVATAAVNAAQQIALKPMIPGYEMVI